MKTTKRLTTGELKKCTNCKRKRDTSLFNFSKASRDGLQSWCRPCLAEAAKEYYWKNPEKHRAYANSRQKINAALFFKRKKKNPSNYLYICAKSRAKKKGIHFDLKPEDIIIPKLCPVLGIKLRFSKGCATDFSPTVDRIIPTLGYIPSNIVVISKRANRIKGDATAAEMYTIAKWLAKLTK
jgi:hypothetical protein